MYKVLLLNASFEPLHVCSWRRAISLLLKGKASQIESNGVMLNSTTHLPTVIKLNYYISLPYKDLPFNRNNIFHRDDYTCQYCGTTGLKQVLTVDHIIPRSKGGGDSWENVITACMHCNTKKGNKTLKESGLKLKSMPHKPSNRIIFELSKALKDSGKEDWNKYLTY